MRPSLPPLYAILDAEFTAKVNLDLFQVARDMCLAGVQLLQYRDKVHQPAQILSTAHRLREIFAGSGCLLILNDWPELALEAGWDGVHVGQGDMAVAETRRIIGSERILGVSTHNLSQVRRADESSADYIAIGPVFATATKANPDAETGLRGVKAARLLTAKPLVAIGGIRREDARRVMEAGADAVAVISDLLVDPRAVGDTVRNFITQLPPRR